MNAELLACCPKFASLLFFYSGATGLMQPMSRRSLQFSIIRTACRNHHTLASKNMWLRNTIGTETVCIENVIKQT